MVNAYKFYCRYLKDINKEPMSHYVLQKIIALIWMDKDNYKTRQREYLTRETCSISSMRKTTTSTTSRRSMNSDSELNPITGTRKCIMNRSLGHWPSVPSRHHIKKSNCQLHYWDTGKRKYINV